ncbi:winged helix-turn-helix domain-containing tetratricopeptide repeat protein [Halomonas maura]|uniref:winged helix-turn-helix domain-containing tetratricopeptide repeat protein n=1 Tax=Halomonas maura TaxID=117606 RepID=UPI0025B56E82|nr:winged helix-turn-helix domain-containing protein [Halomonas maura]MDN3554842.1 winged helix-turn-helix domain-containing protein [Halomonas maura]
MRYRFDDFILDTDRFELSRDGQPLRCEPQVIELLVLLVENRERMVGKDEINEVVWKGRIVSEAALSSRIKMARQLLGDDGRRQIYIRTIHRKGFRFVGTVQFDDPAPAVSASPGAVAPDALHKPAVVVLPLINLSRESDHEYFADGVTSDIIAQLSKHRWLNVVARNTAFGFKGQAPDPLELGRMLAVDYVVEGSIQGTGNQVRIAVHLVDAATRLTKWTERYDRERSEIFALQDEITETIAARLEPEIGFAERHKVRVSRPATLQAWDCFHLGCYHLFRFTGRDNQEAQRLLRQSLIQDPMFGEAHAWWAYAVVLGMVYWDTPADRELLDEALAACDRALEIDHQNATFHMLRGRVLLARREYRRALAENRIAIDLNPTFAAAYCGMGDSLAYECRYEEAMAQFERSIALSPNDPQLWAFYTYGALALIFKGDYERSLEWTEQASNLPNCQYWTAAHRLVALAHLGRREQASEEKERLLAMQPAFSCAFAIEKLFYLHEPSQITCYLAGLRRAKVPEG